MVYPTYPDYSHSKIYTVGTGDLKWRTIKCSLGQHEVKSQGICINGVLYYLAEKSDYDELAHHVTHDYVIVCFDVRSEKFTFIDVEGLCSLIKYKSKLAVIYWENDVDAAAINELRMWVLEDVEKHEWLKYAYTLSDDRFSHHHVSVAGVTASGEIVFAMRKYTSKQPFYVFYFNPERNNLRCVEIQGFGEVSKSVYTFVDHVENLNINDPKLLKSFHTPYVEPNYESSSDSE